MAASSLDTELDAFLQACKMVDLKDRLKKNGVSFFFVQYVTAANWKGLFGRACTSNLDDNRSRCIE